MRFFGLKSSALQISVMGISLFALMLESGCSTCAKKRCGRQPAAQPPCTTPYSPPPPTPIQPPPPPVPIQNPPPVKPADPPGPVSDKKPIDPPTKPETKTADSPLDTPLQPMESIDIDKSKKAELDPISTIEGIADPLAAKQARLILGLKSESASQAKTQTTKTVKVVPTSICVNCAEKQAEAQLRVKSVEDLFRDSSNIASHL